MQIPTGHFRKIAWSKFVPESCLDILADEQDAYAGLKNVLFAAVCIWTIAPQNGKLIKGAITLAALKTLSDAEEAPLAGMRPKSAATDINARYTLLGQRFIEEIYYPIGGAMGLARAPSINDFRAAIRDESPRIDYAISVVQIYHYHAMNLHAEPRYGKASLNKAAGLIEKLGITHGGHKAPPKSRYVKEVWARSRESIALLYAASTIQTTSGVTLLDKIKTANNNLHDDGPLISAWLARAQFVVDFILSKNAETDTHKENNLVIPPSALQQAMPAPVFSVAQQEAIRAGFNRSAV